MEWHNAAPFVIITLMNNYKAHKLIIIFFFLFILLLSFVPQRKELPSSRLEKVVTTDGNV